MKIARLIALGVVLTLVGCTAGGPGAGTPAPARQEIGWNLKEPADPGTSAIVEPNGTGFRLKPDWKVAHIAFLYEWWGLGGAVLDYQQIELEGSGYKHKDNGRAVPQEDIQALVNALDRFYPIQELVGGYAGFDNYPSWAVELTGTDGQHMLLISRSTGNPGDGPWNLLADGRLYAQYDGSLAGPLGALFKNEEGKPMAGYYPGGREPGHVTFSAGGLPQQLVYGFWGVLPISNDFSYTADPGKSEISGRIVGGRSIGSMKIGKIIGLLSVELRQEGKATISCKTENLPKGDPFTPVTAWEFNCPVAEAAEGKAYSYVIAVQLGTEEGSPLTVEGELYGVWQSEQATVLLPLSAELAEALPKNAEVADLLKDHALSHAYYSASLEPDKPMEGVRRGEAIFLGSTQIDGQAVRYTMGTYFSIEDGKLSYWSLDRPALDAMLKTITALPLTRRVLKADPKVVINMWYAKGDPPEQRFGMIDGDTSYKVQVNPCGSIPGGIFPGKDGALQAFGYNRYASLDRPDFVLIDGKPVVADLDLWPLHEEDPVRKALVPDAFDTGEARPFSRVWIEASPFIPVLGRDEPRVVPNDTRLTLWIADDATPEERAVYERIYNALPGTVNRDPIGWRELFFITFTATEEGKLEVVGCSK